jgi:hypothetical protein
VEPTLADLQSQIDQLSAAVARERETPGSVDALDELSELAERCREILRRWTEMDDRHAEALGEVEARLGEWSAIERRLERDSADRLRALEDAIEREWKTLKDIHEAPARELKEQADTLSQTSVAAANLSLKAFERTEARLAAFEEDIQQRLTQLSQDVHQALNQVRRDGAVGSALPPAVAPFPLEGIMRIHEEHREGNGSTPAPVVVDAPAGPQVQDDPHDTVDVPPVMKPWAALPAAASEWADRLAVLERELASERQGAREAAERADKQHKRETFTTFLVVIGLLAIAGFFGFRLEQDVSNRIQDANTRVANAEHEAQTASDTASRAVASAKADADKQIADAKETARRADVTSSVLASGDLLRLNLEGADATGRAAGQAWFSRSSGLVVNASHVQELAAGTVYQVWLIGSGGPVAVGFLDLDKNGHAVLATSTPPDVPRPVSGLMVTIEPTGGRPAPTGPILLTRAPQ